MPTAAAAARLAATRAALGVLLRLAQLPGGARALCESGAMAALAACRAVDAYAHDSPGDAAAAAAAARARARAEAARAGGAGFEAPAESMYARIGYGDDDMDFAEESMSRGVLEERGGVDPASAAAVAAASPLALPPLARARHHALLVPVLRLAGTLLNASPDEATREGAVAFCRAHAAVLHRVLADRSKHAHLCDVAELEAAVALVARLVATTTTTTTRSSAADANVNGFSTTTNSSSSSNSSLSSLSEFIPALDALTTRLARGDGKYDHFIAAASDARSSVIAHTSHGEVARRVAESAAGGRDAAIGGLSAPVAAAAAAKMEKALRSVRATLVSAQLSLAERGAAAFAAAERPGEDARAAPRPTLAAFARLAHRCAEEMREELKARRVELRRLARDGGAAAAAAAADDARGAGGSASAEAAAAFAAAGAGTFAEALEARGGGGPGGVSALGGPEWDASALASLSAAAVGARERGARALAVTAEAALELVLLGAFGQGASRASGPSGYARDAYDAYDAFSKSDDLMGLARVLAPAIGALAELDRDETAAETAFFGASFRSGGFDASSTEDERGGFAGGVCADGGRLRALVRRARDALAAFAPPNAETEHASLLAGPGPGVPREPGSAVTAAKRFGGARATEREW